MHCINNNSPPETNCSSEIFQSTRVLLLTSQPKITRSTPRLLLTVIAKKNNPFETCALFFFFFLPHFVFLYFIFKFGFVSVIFCCSFLSGGGLVSFLSGPHRGGRLPSWWESRRRRSKSSGCKSRLERRTRTCNEMKEASGERMQNMSGRHAET